MIVSPLGNIDQNDSRQSSLKRLGDTVRRVTDADRPAALNAMTSFLLTTGGDRRILCDAGTGRNRYGTRTTIDTEEISFSSTTATNVSHNGLVAARMALERLVNVGTARSPLVELWFDDIRERINAVLGEDQAQIILTASGTDAELLAVALMAGCTRRRVTNIVVAPDETGSGVIFAAAGCHYSDVTAIGRPVQAGILLEGLEPGRINVVSIAIRDMEGRPLTTETIDEELIAAVERELANDRDVIVHVLDTSKTGLTGVSRQAARYAMSLAPERVRVIVDACQLRGPVSQLREDLRDGFVVAITGSKFLAGPAFSGALLLPQAFADELGSRVEAPAGIADYTAMNDWPERLRQRMRLRLPSRFNVGLGLRWVAALAGSTDHARVPDSLRFSIMDAFAQLVRRRIGDTENLCLHADDDGHRLASSAIVPITIATATGAFASFEQAQLIHRRMREPEEGQICHLGQAVRVGPRSVLRIAASAIDVSAVAAAMASGSSFEQAFEQLESKLDTLFRKLAIVQHRLGDA